MTVKSAALSVAIVLVAISLSAVLAERLGGLWNVQPVWIALLAIWPITFGVSRLAAVLTER